MFSPGLERVIGCPVSSIVSSGFPTKTLSAHLTRLPLLRVRSNRMMTVEC